MENRYLNVLHVEDNPDDRQLLLDYLLEMPDHNLRIVSCDSLARAHELCAESHPDAVLLDLNLPDSTGLETFFSFHKAYPALPVIVLTMTDLRELATESVRSGAQDYLIKSEITGPFLYRAIGYAIERKAVELKTAKYTDRLEQIIAERTEELVQSNTALKKEIIQKEAAQAKLSQRHQLLLDILDGIQAAVLYVDAETHRIVRANTVAEQITGFSIDKLIGAYCCTYLADTTKKDSPYNCPARKNRTVHIEQNLTRPDGSFVPVTKTILPMDIGGHPHFIEILFDVSRRKEVDRQLAHALKMESVGQLAAGIAHEINTPSQYISDNLKFIGGGIAAVESILSKTRTILDFSGEAPKEQTCNELRAEWKALDIDYYLQEIPNAVSQSTEGIHRISDIVMAMKRFTHPGKNNMQFADINEALQSTSIVCRNEWKYHAEMKMEFEESLPLVPCHINDLNQVFLNVLVNAAQAIAEKHADGTGMGVITVRTRSLDGMVEISIQDTGAGIAPEVLPKIFDPFFTTKEVGIGTGQGLTLCHSIIVDKHRGSINMKSTKGVGSTCIITLPLGQEEDQ